MDPNDGTVVPESTPEDRGDVLPEETIIAEVEEEELPEPQLEEEEVGGPEKITIPKTRLDQATKKFRDREQELMDRIQALEGRQPAPSAKPDEDVDVLQVKADELTDEYEELLIEGEKDKAREIRKQINAMNRQISSLTAAQMTAQSRQAAVEDIRYDQTLSLFEEQYPVIDSSSDQFDQALVSEVVDLKNAYQQAGRTPTAALKKAISLLVATRAAQAPEPETPSPAKPASDLRQERAVAARNKVTKAVKSQPPSTSQAGHDNLGGLTPETVTSMSQDKFAQLSEEDLSKLRGDTVS